LKNKYFDLIDQTFYFPQEGFDLEEGYLTFHGLSIKYLIDKYGTPLKITYLPKIGIQIKKARNLFNKSIKSSGYKGEYKYCYCTKSSHFRYIIEEVLKYGSMLETSSSYDIDIVHWLAEQDKLDKEIILVHNGFKPQSYIDKIGELHEAGYVNSIPILDNMEELEMLKNRIKGPLKIGVRLATEEEPNFAVYTSRLGIPARDLVGFCKKRIARSKKIQLKMLHFFVDTGIKDSLYYWGELKRAIKMYCELKRICPELRAINIGGGMPIRNSLGFEFDYNYMVKEIISLIQQACDEEAIEHPDIITEFGKYTVGESGATIFSVLGQKRQNQSELWYLIDNSLMNTIPDSWGINERFILLPINKWDKEYTRVNIGGISCDNSDFYNSEIHENQLFLPAYDPKDEEPLYLGFFHTGAYQDALSGFGGIKHCLIPAPKHVLIRKNSKGDLVEEVTADIQSARSMLDILGYTKDAEAERIKEELKQRNLTTTKAK